MKKLILITLMALMFASPASAEYGLKQWRIDIVDSEGAIVTGGNFTITVFGAGESSATTIYSDEYATSKTNPVTPASDSTSAAGRLIFYSAATSLDIQITSSVYSAVVKETSHTITDHTIIYEASTSGGFKLVEEVTTSSNTLTAAESGKIFVSSYTGTQTVNLPSAAAGLYFTFIDGSSTGGDDLIINPATGDKIDKDTAGQEIRSNTDAYPQMVTLFAEDATDWWTIVRVGTWTQE